MARSESKRADASHGAPFCFEALLRRPEQRRKSPPCQAHGCPNGVDIRGWMGVVAQREKLGLTLDEACTRAWSMIVEVNPFPATTGRICPHPCQERCNRGRKDGAVNVSQLERYLGDFAIARGLRLPAPDQSPRPEALGVVGAGPAGLSFAYQAARRGHRVAVYESSSDPGGMLQWGIPEYRLPRRVLAAEIQRILDLGVALQLNCRVGTEISLDELRDRHHAVFVGIGAQLGRRLGTPGESGVGCSSGTEYLRLFNANLAPDLGPRVAVVGGGNTAIDAARAARRNGCQVTICYRRTREEMPASPAEIDEAIEEGVRFEFLVAPVAVLRHREGEEETVRGLRLQRMTLGDPDASGRRRPTPIEGELFDLPVSGVISAVSQAPDWRGLEGMKPEDDWLAGDSRAPLSDGIWAGGDICGPGTASLAIAQGRVAAEALCARLRGEEPASPVSDASIEIDRLDAELYAAASPVRPPRLSPKERLSRPTDEVVASLEEASFVEEVQRCMSCGSCFDCRRCETYCNAAGFTRLARVAPGAYFALHLDRCEGCGKCIDVCPCGYLSLRE